MASKRILSEIDAVAGSGSTYTVPAGASSAVVTCMTSFCFSAGVTSQLRINGVPVFTQLTDNVAQGGAADVLRIGLEPGDTVQVVTSTADTGYQVTANITL